MSASRTNILEITDGDKNLTGDYLNATSALDREDIHQFYKIIKKLLNKYPGSGFLKCIFAALHGDVGQFLNGKESVRMNVEAVEILEKLMKENFNPRLAYYVKNEYFYHTGRFKDQFLLGKIEAKAMKTGKKGSFSSGVGASEYGFELFLKEDIKGAQKFGKLGVWHWENSGRNLHLNCFYLQALALSGRPQKALSLFKQQIKKYPYYKKQKVWLDLREKQLEYILGTSY